MNIQKKFEDLIAVVEDAGKLARTYFESDDVQKEQKSDGSLVTEIDQKIESILRTHIQKHFPNDSIIGEEDEDVVGTSGFSWYIDPIDGTENFIRRIPLFAVTAVRLSADPEDTFSIIHNPVTGQTFASLMENGTYENKRLCNLSAQNIRHRYAINVASGDKEKWCKVARYSLYKELALAYGRSGTFNSGLLDFAYVAASRIDGFLSLKHAPWDSAAGVYLVKAAGGSISVFRENKWFLWERPIKELYGEDGHGREIIFVSRPDIHNEVLDFIGDPMNWAKK